jgi:hypothetical protein
MKGSPFGDLNVILVMLILAVLGCACANSNDRKVQIDNAANENTEKNQAPPLASPSVSPTPTPLTVESPSNPKSSPEYQTGYKRGYKEGRSWAKEVVGGGMPTSQGIRTMASYQASESGSKDQPSWADGWYDGFGDGYQGIKPAKIHSSNLQPLSWANAKPGVKLYDHEGNYQVTITTVNQAYGTITVKYPASRGGVTEDKSLTSLSSFWFVKVE